MTNNNGWHTLPDDVRYSLLYRFYVLKKEVAVPGIKQSTLNRRMREEKNRLEDDGKWHLVLAMENGQARPNTSVEFNGPNQMSVGVKGGEGRIWTLEELVEVMQIDLNEWEVYKVNGSTYEGYRKNEEKSLTWEDGSIVNGYSIDHGGLWIEPMMSIKAWFVRRTPVEVKPVLRPVEITINKSLFSKPIKSKKEFKTALIVPDLQIGYSRDFKYGILAPFVDRTAVDVVLQVAQEGNFDVIVFLGDLLDMTAWSDKFIRSPEFMQTTQPAIIEAAWWLAQFREACPHAEMYLLEGNHEYRIKTMLAVHLEDAYNLRSVEEINLDPALSIPKLLGLRSLGIEWVEDYPNNRVWLNDSLVCEHGNVARKAGTTALGVVSGRDHSVIFGHIHRAEMATKSVRTRSGPQMVVAMCPGFLGHLDGRIPGNTESQEWNQGFAIAAYNDAGMVRVNHIPILDGEALVDGELIQGRNRDKDLRSFALDLSNSDWGL